MNKINFVTKVFLIFIPMLGMTACQTHSPEQQGTEAKPLPNGVTLIKDASDASKGEVNSAAKQKSRLHITYKKFRLDNGLTVILHQDSSDPLVHVDVTYHVGSSREEPGKSGFAHFFEHMMFQGSENVADEQHFKIVTEAGGTMNGTTNSDRTNYYQTVPANQLEKMLWLEADRMGFLLDAVTQKKFEIQRETVKNERAQRVDNRPYGLRAERVAEALYPSEHPYHWPVIGYIEDLNRVDVNDLKAFFSRWYGPNNAVLTIGGSIDETETLEWVVKYFAEIPMGPDVQKLAKLPVTLEKDKHISLEDDVHLPLIHITFPTVHARHEDEAPLDVLADILGGGKTSLFYKNLVKDGWAVHAGVGHPCRELACQFELISLPNPQRLQSLRQLKDIITATLTEFEQRGVNNDDLLRTKASIKAGTIFSLQSVAGKVSTLASNQIYSGEPDMLDFDTQRYDSVTIADVMRVYERYIKDKASVTLSIVPKGQLAMQAAEPDFVTPARVFEHLQRDDFEAEPIQAGATQVDVTQENANVEFDRSQMPPAGSNPVVAIPDFWQMTLKNDIPVMVHETSETPTVSLVLSLEGGPLLDPIAKAGLAAMTADMMSETTKNYTNEQLANELAKLGSTIGFSSAGRFTTITVSSLTENLNQTLALLQEKLFNPAFEQADFDRLKAQTLQGLQQATKNPEVLSRNAITSVLYGEQNRIGLPDGGTIETISDISLGDVKAFYAEHYNASMASVIVVGEVNKAELQKQLSFLSDWQSKPYTIAPYKPFPDLSEKTVYVVNHPAAAQSIVNFVKPSLPFDAEGLHFKSKLVNFPFGGAFNSRINLNLREDKGFTYGVRSSFSGGKTLGRFQTGGAINKEHTIAAMDELRAEMKNYQTSGMTDEELSFMRNAYTQGDALNYETPGSKAVFLRHMSVYGLDSQYPTRQNQIINTISKEELDQIASSEYDPDTMQIVIVADLSELGDAIAAWAEADGRKVIDLTQ